MIRLRLLGPPGLDRDDDTAVRSVLAQPKRFAVLAYLAASHPSRQRSRDTLLGVFWPELDDRHARKALRQSLYDLRRSLGRGALTGKGRELVGVDPERVSCDASHFSTAVDEGRDEEALDLYGGPFLEGFHLSGAPEFERWVEVERRRLVTQAEAAAWRLAESARSEGDRAKVRRWAERALELAPYDGESVRRYISLMGRLGQPAAAVRAYEAYAGRLAADLDLRPSPDTTALVERIRNGEADDGRLSARTSGPRTGESDGSPGGAPPTADAASGRSNDGQPVSGAPAGSPGEAADRPEENAEDVPGRGERAAAGSAASVGGADVSFLRSLSRRGRRRVAAVTAILGFAALAYVSLAALDVVAGPGGDVPRIRSLAVLPLDNLSGDPGQEYLSDGMTEALIAELGEISSLKVISRTSVTGFGGAAGSSPEIARELGVDGLVEGSVLRAGDRVRIVLRLVHGPTDRQLWSETFEQDTRDVQALQDQMVRGIAGAVRADISPVERRRMQDRPTEVAEAYSHLLRGNGYLRRESRKDWEMAEELYATAVELDPGFARAWERLVYVRGILGVSRMDTAALSGAREALSRLRSLGRDRPETHAAEGWYAFWVQGDLDRASREFEALREERPGNARTLWAAARIHRRATRWEASASALERLLELDPRNPEVPALLARVRAAQRRFDEAERHIDRALSLAPDNHFYYVTKWRVLALGHGDTARAGKLIDEAEPYVREAEHAWLRAIVEEFRRDFPAAVEGFGSWPAASRTKHLFVSRLADQIGWTATAEAHADSLERIAADRLERAIRLQNVRQMAVAHYEMARVHAIYGRHDEAIREGEEGLRLMPPGTFSSAPSLAQGLVWIYARAGRHEEALRLLERLLELPGGETIHSLRFNPVYDALREDPGFRALLRGRQAS